jgi:hypothetical protein
MPQQAALSLPRWLRCCIEAPLEGPAVQQIEGMEGQKY